MVLPIRDSPRVPHSGSSKKRKFRLRDDTAERSRARVVGRTTSPTVFGQHVRLEPPAMDSSQCSPRSESCGVQYFCSTPDRPMNNALNLASDDDESSEVLLVVHRRIGNSPVAARNRSPRSCRPDRSRSRLTESPRNRPSEDVNRLRTAATGDSPDTVLD